MRLENAYAVMIDRAHESCYFMWDAIKDALIMELQDSKFEFTVNLCQLLKNPFKQGILIDALTEYGKVSPDNIQKILAVLYKNSMKTDEVAYILLEVAYNLEKFDYLEQLATHKNHLVRQSVARFLYYLWRQKPNASLQILDKLANKVRNHSLPNINILSTCLYTSLLILADAGVNNNELLLKLRKLWVVIVDKILYRDLDNMPIVGGGVKFLREGFVNTVSLTGWYVLAPIWEASPLYTIDRQDFEKFFLKDRKTRAEFCQIVDLLDSDFDELENHENDFYKIIEDDDIMPIILMNMVLSFHARQYNFPIISTTNNPVIGFIKKGSTVCGVRTNQN
jgi:hypothetical protein